MDDEKCPKCGITISHLQIEEGLRYCPKCGWHLYSPYIKQRFRLIKDVFMPICITCPIESDCENCFIGRILSNMK